LVANPYDAGARANLGRLLAGAGDWKQAAFQLQRAVQLEPDDANAHMAYSVVLAQMNRLGDAEKEAEAAVRASPGSTQARDLLAQIQAQRGTRR
jgi:protein involved in temperature-dependent protein secretion